MKSKRLRQIITEAYERYPDSTELHHSMRETYIWRMKQLDEYERKEFNNFIFQLAQLIAIVLMIIAIILL